MALKTKGGHTPKAGPKRRQARTEAEAIKQAVEDHSHRINPGRKSSKVNRYSYRADEREKQQRARAFVSEMDRLYGLREPKHTNAFLAFFDALNEDEQPFATKLFQMSCEHDDEVLAEKPSFTNGNQPEVVACRRCGLARTWWGTPTETKRQEFTGYCPDGFDMFDWVGLYTKDRSMWRFIHDEVLAEMVDESMTEEAA